MKFNLFCCFKSNVNADHQKIDEKIQFISTPELKLEVKQLLQQVVAGELEEVEILLKKNSKLLLETGFVKDLSGNYFRNITAIKYAYWAMDLQMFKLLLRHIPAEAAAQQLKDWEKHCGDHGIHVDWNDLISALMEFGEKFLLHPERLVSPILYGEGFDKIAQNYLFQCIGTLQRALPVHAVSYYCQSRSTPFNFEDEKENLKRICHVESINIHWYSGKIDDGLLGKTWAVVRTTPSSSDHPSTSRAVNSTMFLPATEGEWWKKDKQMLEDLYNTRLKQMERIRQELNSSLSSNSIDRGTGNFTRG